MSRVYKPAQGLPRPSTSQSRRAQHLGTVLPAIKGGWLDTLGAENRGDVRTVFGGMIDCLHQRHDRREFVRRPATCPAEHARGIEILGNLDQRLPALGGPTAELFPPGKPD